MADESNTAASSTETPKDELPEPSAAEAVLFVNVVKNLESNPDINWDGVALDCGFKNAAVAKKRFYQVKIRLGLDSKSPSKPSRKAKTAGESSPAASPSKPGRNEQGSPSKVQKRRKQPAVKTEMGPETGSPQKGSPKKGSPKKGSPVLKTERPVDETGTSSVKTENDDDGL